MGSKTRTSAKQTVAAIAAAKRAIEIDATMTRVRARARDCARAMRREVQLQLWTAQAEWCE